MGEVLHIQRKNGQLKANLQLRTLNGHVDVEGFEVLMPGMVMGAVGKRGGRYLGIRCALRTRGFLTACEAV